MSDRPYCNGIGIQIQCRENYDCLLELEQMGGKVRDTDDEYLGAEGRDDRTKLMISPRYTRVHSYIPDMIKPVTLKSNPDSGQETEQRGDTGLGVHFQTRVEKGMQAPGGQDI